MQLSLFQFLSISSTYMCISTPSLSGWMRSMMSAQPAPGAGPRQVKGKCAASFICVLITRAARSCEHGARRAGVASTEIIFLSWGGSQDGFINPGQISFPPDRGRGLTAGVFQLWHRCTSTFSLETIYYFIIRNAKHLQMGSLVRKILTTIHTSIAS